MAVSEDQEDMIMRRLKFIECRIRFIAEAFTAVAAIVVGLCIYWFQQVQVEINNRTTGALATVVVLCRYTHARRLLARE